MIYNIKGCHHQRHPFTYIGTILYGTISVRLGDEALKTSYLSVFFGWVKNSIPITRSIFLAGSLINQGFPLFLYYLV